MGYPNSHSEARRKGRAFGAHFSPRPPKHMQFTALEPCAEKLWGAAWRRKGAEYSSPPSTMQMGAKLRLAEVPPGQLQRFTLRTQGRLPSIVFPPSAAGCHCGSLYQILASP